MRLDVVSTQVDVTFAVFSFIADCYLHLCVDSFPLLFLLVCYNNNKIFFPFRNQSTVVVNLLQSTRMETLRAHWSLFCSLLCPKSLEECLAHNRFSIHWNNFFCIGGNALVFYRPHKVIISLYSRTRISPLLSPSFSTHPYHIFWKRNAD